MGEPNQVKWVGTRKVVPAVADLSAFVGQVHDTLTMTAAAGNNTLNSVAVPSGRWHVITHMSMVNISGAMTRSEIRYNDTVDLIRIGMLFTPAQREVLRINGHYYLKTGQIMSFVFVGCAAGDLLQALVHGYYVDID